MAVFPYILLFRQNLRGTLFLKVKFSTVHHFGITQKASGVPRPRWGPCREMMWTFSRGAVPDLQWQFWITNCMTWVLLSHQDGWMAHLALQHRVSCATQLGEPGLVTQEEGTWCYLSYWSKHWSISHWWQPWTRFWFLKSYPWIRAQTPLFLQVITICPKPSITEIPVSVPELLCGLEGTCLPCCSGAATHPGAVLALWPPRLHLGITSPAKSADCVKGSKSSEGDSHGSRLGLCVWKASQLLRRLLLLGLAGLGSHFPWVCSFIVLGQRKCQMLWSQRFSILHFNILIIWEHLMKQEAESKSIGQTENK